MRDIDPIVERVILRCIEKDPRQRPASAAQVAAAPPGGDPLAAALAAGETPSPEMVAASGSTEGLKPWIAWACLAFAIFGIGAYVLMKRHTDLYLRTPMEKPPEVLVQSARDILWTMDIYSGAHAIWAVDWGLFQAAFAGLFLICLLFFVPRIVQEHMGCSDTIVFIFSHTK